MQLTTFTQNNNLILCFNGTDRFSSADMEKLQQYCDNNNIAVGLIGNELINNYVDAVILGEDNFENLAQIMRKGGKQCTHIYFVWGENSFFEWDCQRLLDTLIQLDIEVLFNREPFF